MTPTVSASGKAAAAAATVAPRAAARSWEFLGLASVVLVPAVFCLVWCSAQVELLFPEVAFSLVSGVLAFWLTAVMIPRTAHLFVKAGLFGKDINKNGTPFGENKVPEALGLIPATIYLVILCLLHIRPPARSLVDGTVDGDGVYTAALASVTFMILLGFADDVLDLKWRYKMVLPLFGSLPLLTSYTGSTSILLPMPVFSVLKGVLASRLINLGILYKVYMALLSIFATNAINILAGLNGLEAGQSLVIACFVVGYNGAKLMTVESHVDNLMALQRNQLLSIELMSPFIGVTVALLKYNWNPSAVFVGDTYCYFAGMTFAMAAILGNYSKTMLLFFIPQVINFVYSIPQLVGIVPCPRHRLPRYNIKTGKLEAIKSNLNLVNLTLLLTGPLTEKQLCVVILLFQVLSCFVGLYIEYLVVRW